MTRPPWPVTTSEQRFSKFSTRAPRLMSSSSFESAENRDMSANPTVMVVDSSSASAAPRTSMRAAAAAR
jgi:hypothetical protein